jgi:hypothetical protein
MWIYARSSHKNIIGKRDDCVPWIWIGNNYRIGFSSYYGVSPPYVENVSSTMPYAVDPNQWTHLVMTRNGTNLSVYKNGVLHTKLTSSMTQNGDRPGIGDLQIGRCGSSARLNALIDELAFFSRTVYPNEIKNMYQRGIINLNISVSSCDDPNCVGESWIDINDTSPQNLNVPDNRYFMYKIAFISADTVCSPKLYNVTIRYVTGDNQQPYVPTILTAPPFGTPDIQLNFSVSTEDPEEDDIYYMWNWGDGSYSNWLGPFDSGQTVETIHEWDEIGEFEVRVKAKDIFEAESDWSDSVLIIIENKKPDIIITKPIEGNLYFLNEILFPFFTNLIIGPIDIKVDAFDNISGINRVEFYIDNELKKTDLTAPYMYKWYEKGFSLYKFEAIAFDNAGNYAKKDMTIFKFF